MEFLAAVIERLADPSNWLGRDGVLTRVAEHLVLSGAAVAAASLIAFPAGLVTGHTGRGGFAVTSAANVGRAVPSIAILSLALIFTIRFLGLGFGPTLIALVFLAVPPILANAHIGIREVDRELVEAARGLGMRESQILATVELPIALPVIIAGLRTASVQVIATATLGALVASGGLGRYLVDGIATQDEVEIFLGAFLVAVLALLADLAFGAAERRTRPRRGGRSAASVVPEEPSQAVRPGAA